MFVTATDKKNDRPWRYNEMNKLRYAIVFIGNILVLPVLAHHSDAGMDMDSVIAFEGTVKEFVWRNPHVYVIVETEQCGEPIDWEVQMGRVNVC